MRILRKLNLDNVPAGDDILGLIAGLKKLKALRLTHSADESLPFTGDHLDRLACLPVLERALFYQSHLGDRALLALARCPRLNFLQINDTMVTDGGMKTLAGSTSLKYLIVSHNGITDAGLASLAQTKPLERLEVNNTNVTREGLTAFLKARPDVRLFAGDQPVDDEVPTTLENVATIPLKPSGEGK